MFGTHVMDPQTGLASGLSQSPTQSNEDRSYDRFEDPESLPPFSLGPLVEDRPGDGDSLPDRSLGEDDTGAVRFSLSSAGLYSESPPASDVDRAETRRSHFFAASEDDKFLAAAVAPPQTPCPPRNPFAGQFQTPLPAGSQLFVQTPFSAAIQQGSPTSSRPSSSGFLAPAATPRVPVSSSLKPRFPASSIGDETPILLCPLSTSSQAGDSPRPSIVPQSSPVLHKRKATGPISEYEPMRESQRRREASRRRNDGFDSSSDDDVKDVSQKRRRLARYKREAGARMLSTISMTRPSFKEDVVEVPASSRGEDRPRPKEQSPSSLQALAEGDLLPTTAETVLVEDSGKTSAGPLESEGFEEVEFPQSMIDQYSARPPPIAKTPSSSVPSLPMVTPTAAKAVKAQPTLYRTSSLNETIAIPETSPAGRKRMPTKMVSSGSYSQPRPELTPQDLSGSSTHTAILIQTSLPVSQRTAASLDTSAEKTANTSILSDVPELRTPAGVCMQVLGQERRQDQGTDPARVSLKHKPILDSDATTAGTSSPPALPPAFSTRAWSRKARGDDAAAKAKRLSAAMSPSSRTSSTSAVSSLSSTPSLPSREVTPTTANESDLSACKSAEKTNTAATIAVATDEFSSPPLPISRLPFRRQRSRTLSRSKAVSTGSFSRSRTMTRRLESPLLSGSTDELSMSPAYDSVFEQSVGPRGRNCTTRPTSARPLSGLASGGVGQQHNRSTGAAGRVFEGMAFAISFQAQRPDESREDCEERMKQARTLQQRIQEAGGRVLENGFDELFRAPPVMTATTAMTTVATGADMQLVASAADTGFTALIADGHSRKAKYMQALALGLPCLAVRWATTCLERGVVVDWTPYLLCAGPSAFLGDAIRSRTLAAVQTTLAAVMVVVGGERPRPRQRPRLLEDVTILLVLRRREDPRRMPYVFLAQVLGASLTRVHSLEEAREQLLAMEDVGRPYDWVYEEGRAGGGGGGSDFFHSLAAASKKRKRPNGGTTGSSAAAAAAAAAARMPQPVSILSNERVIQSLIFGRLIEEDEMAM